jgi:pimeloyl-ACP methyl ester carboxylesterase
MKKIVIVFLLLVLVLASPVIIKIYGLQPIVQSDIPSQGNWAQLTQGNLYYRWDRPLKENDNGETLVLVHGFSTPHFVWDGIKQILLDSGYSVLVYDHFGRGYSERPAATYHPELYIESLNELLGHQKLN